MRAEIRFEGRVQGVGFRATTREAANGLAVTGWVRNEPDGSVVLQVQGKDDVIAALLARIRDRLGRFITSEHRAAIPEQAGESGFSISR